MRLLLAARFHCSGQTTHVVELARALTARGDEVSVVALGRSHPGAVQAYQSALSEAGAHFYTADNTERLRWIAWSVGAQVLHGHSSTAVPALLEVRESVGAPVVFTCHGLGVPARTPRLRDVDRLIAVGPNVAAELSASGLAAETIGNGVDTIRFRPGRRGRNLRVAFVGRVDATKRRALIELCRAVRDIPEAELVVASNDRPCVPSCTSVGWVWDVAPLLARSHIVFGAGRALREGMAAGCAAFLLGVRYGGPVIPKRLEQGEFPWFPHSAGDPPNAEAIRRDIVRLGQDRSALHAIGAASRAIACRRFSLPAMAERTWTVYRDVLGLKGQ